LKSKEFKSGMIIIFSVLALLAMTGSGYCQDDRDSVWVWYGDVSDSDTIDVGIGERVYLDFYIQTPSTAWIADCHFCMGAQDKYIDSLLSHIDGVYYYPFTEWQVATFLEPQDSVQDMPEGWTSQSFVGIATYYLPVPWLHYETPTRILTWVLHTANDPINIGDDARAIGDEGRNFPQGPTNIGDTLGGAGYVPVETFSIFHFTGGGYIDGVITNVEDDPIEGVSIVNDLTGKETFSNENGEYHMGLYPGTHALTFSHPDYIEVTIEDIIVIEDQTNQMDVVMNQLGMISGTVSDNDSDPIMGVIVSIAGQSADTTDAEGAYFIGGLEAGNYDVDFSHVDYRDTTATGVQVQDNETTYLNMILNQFGAVTGIVANNGGSPISGVIVTADTESDTTDADGIYYLGGLDTGSYDVSFSHNAYVDTTVSDVEVQFNNETILDITLHQLGGIRGAVTDAVSSEAIEGVQVLIIETGDSDTTNAAGLFSFSGIGPGIYEISFSHSEYNDTVVTDVEVSYDGITMLNVEMEPPTGINDNIAAIPEIYSLNQNYPNPFNAVTCIKYGLPEDAHVVIGIYDVLGRQVETLVNEFQAAGYHQATWNAYDLTSGMYFYVIQANDFIKRKSMMLLK